LHEKTTNLIKFIDSKANKKGIIKKIEARILTREVRDLGESFATLRADRTAIIDQANVQLKGMAAKIDDLEAQAGRDGREIVEAKETIEAAKRAIERARGKIEALEMDPNRKAMKKLRTEIYSLKAELAARFENTPGFNKLFGMMLEMYEQIIGPIVVPIQPEAKEPENKETADENANKNSVNKLP